MASLPYNNTLVVPDSNRAKVRQNSIAQVGGTDYVPFKVYKGCTVIYPFWKSLSELELFQAIPGDVCICAFPKSGTTAMSVLALLALTNGDPSCIQTGAPIKMKVPYLDGVILRDENYEVPVLPVNHLRTITDRPRIYAAHLNANGLPFSVLQVAKVLYIFRNPKDTIVSTYHFLSWLNMKGAAKGTMDEIIDLFLKDEIYGSPYFEHVESFWRLRNQPNVCVTSFEDFIKDPSTVVRNISRFLDRRLTTEQVESVVRYTSFKQMKANDLTNVSEVEKLGWADGKGSFMRKGKVGDWKTELTPEQSAKIDAWTEESLARRPALKGLVFQYE